MSPAGRLGGVRTHHPSLTWDQTQMLGKPAVAGPGEGAREDPTENHPFTSSIVWITGYIF